MARRPKTGLEYYNIDTNIFQNRKIKRLLRGFGAKGYLVYSYLITEIYRDEGYFLEWDENTAFDVSDIINEAETLVTEVVSYCCTMGLFNKELFTSENVLTTKNIQEFWINVSKGANRKCSDVDVRFNLVSPIGTPKPEESTLKPESIPPKAEETPQRKGKETKVNQSKVKKSTKSVPPDFQEFKDYALDKTPDVDLEKLNLKYQSWIENGWKTGKDTAIKNWKATLLNTLSYLKKEKNYAKKEKKAFHSNRN